MFLLLDMLAVAWLSDENCSISPEKRKETMDYQTMFNVDIM